MMAPTLVGDNRRPPHGVPANSVNWVCVPPNSAAKRVPTQAKGMGLIRDATQMVGQLQQAIWSLCTCLRQCRGCCSSRHPRLGPGAAGGGGAAVAAGLGFNAGAREGSSNPNAVLKALEQAVAQLQALSLGDKKDKRDRKKDKKKKDKRKDKKKKKSKKKKS